MHIVCFKLHVTWNSAGQLEHFFYKSAIVLEYSLNIQIVADGRPSHLQDGDLHKVDGWLTAKALIRKP